MRLTLEYVKQCIEEEGYILISNTYNNAKDKLQMVCPQGHNIKMNWNNFKSGRRCKECGKHRMGTRVNEQDIKTYVESQNYTLLEINIVNHVTRIKVLCPYGHVYEVKWQHFKNGVRCPKEKGGVKFNYEEVCKYVNEQGYTLLDSVYKGVYDKLNLICPKGHHCSISFHNFKNGQTRCRKCKESKGEKEVSRVLDELGMNYKTQYVFDKCEYKRSLPFDFYIPHYNVCIEYDGEQHYKKEGSFGNINSYKEISKRDEIKTNFCLNNEIELIRIPYWAYKNIEKILKNRFT